MADSDDNSEEDAPHLPRWRAVGDLSDARRLQWRAVKAAERLVYDAYEAGRPHEARKAVASLTQAVRCYTSVVEQAELEERVQRLEEVVEQQNRHSRNGTLAP